MRQPRIKLKNTTRWPMTIVGFMTLFMALFILACNAEDSPNDRGIALYNTSYSISNISPEVPTDNLRAAFIWTRTMQEGGIAGISRDIPVDSEASASFQLEISDLPPAEAMKPVEAYEPPGSAEATKATSGAKWALGRMVVYNDGNDNAMLDTLDANATLETIVDQIAGPAEHILLVYVEGDPAGTHLAKDLGVTTGFNLLKGIPGDDGEYNIEAFTVLDKDAPVPITLSVDDSRQGLMCEEPVEGPNDDDVSEVRTSVASLDEVPPDATLTCATDGLAATFSTEAIAQETLCTSYFLVRQDWMMILDAQEDAPTDWPCAFPDPDPEGKLENSFRDPRWITGSDTQWVVGPSGIGSFELTVWEDGTARFNGEDGQWFTSNNIALVFVPSSGSIVKFAYIFLDETQGTVISDQGYLDGYIGRFAKAEATTAKPTVPDLQSGADLAAAAGEDYKMVDMENIPASAQDQDERLLDGPDHGWFQDNSNAGGTHHFRKDVDADEFRFTVYDNGETTMLANGEWFTVNNTFLRITHASGYTTDYLYALDADGTFYHISYQGYERADFRIFKLEENGSDTFLSTCGDICIDEIPKGEEPSFYAGMERGLSTFVPVPCPEDGCE